MSNRLLISFSGGETSAFMTHWILRNWQNQYDEIVVVFANTGEEREETLEFVRDCDERFGFGTVWVEAITFHGERRSSGARVVNFETASRNGEPFEQTIMKYGIPNPKFKGCTRNLKRNPIEAFARSLGWPPNSWDTAIGIRTDEIDRMSEDARNRRLVYPLVRPCPMNEAQISGWWSRQNFRLRLKGYEGNCRTCWKKSFRKLMTIAEERPEFFDFNSRMESAYDLVGPEFRHDPATRLSPLPIGYRRTFFRENKSTEDIFAMLAERKAAGRFIPAADSKSAMEFDFGTLAFDEEIDGNNGCEEACEPYGIDDTDEEISA